jgi:hypothetical protein
MSDDIVDPTGVNRDIACIEKATALFALRPVDREYAIIAFEGLLSPTESYVVPYGRAALHVSGHVRKNPKDRDENTRYMFQGSFSSIDDSGLTFHGPQENEASATRRYHAFESFIRERHPMMPTLEQVEEWGKRHGVYPDLW